MNGTPGATGTITRRRHITFAVSTLGTGALTAAYGAGQQATSGTAGSGTAGKPALKSGTLSLMSWDAPGDESERNLRAFEGKHAGLKVEYLHTPAGQPYSDKFTSMLAAGVPPHVFLYSITDWVALQQQGVLAELDPFVKRDKLDTQDFFEKALALGQWQGKQYGIGDNFVYNAIFFNKALFNKAGVPVPSSDWKDTKWTWQQFVDDATRISKLEVDGAAVYGFNMGTGFTNLFPWIWNNGGDLFSKDLSTTTITQTQATEALQFVADWRFKHRFAPTQDVLAQENASTLYRQGRLGMWWDGPWSMQALRQVQGLDWDVAPPPRGSAARLMYASGACWFMPKQNQLLEESWALTNHLISKEGQQSMLKRFGFPGSRKSVALSPDFISQRPPEHIRVFADGGDSIRPVPLFPNWPEIGRAINTELTPLFMGQKSAREAAEAVKRAVDPLLKPAR